MTNFNVFDRWNAARTRVNKAIVREALETLAQYPDGVSLPRVEYLRYRIHELTPRGRDPLDWSTEP